MEQFMPELIEAIADIPAAIFYGLVIVAVAIIIR